MTLFNLRVAEHLSHKAHYITHLAYLTLVFFESHGYYGYVAGAMALVVVGGSVLGIKVAALEAVEEKIDELV